MALKSDIQRLEPGRLIELFEVDCSAIGGDILRFHGHLQTESIVWQGMEYRPWPIRAAGFERTSDARQPAPTLTVGDINGTISALCVALGDLVGAKVFRRRTLARYLDAVNFPDGNPVADPNEQFPVEHWRVEQKSDEQPGQQVEFMLSSPLDFGGQQLPNRQIVSMCQFRYRGPNCGYAGTACFDKNDNPVSDPALDRCSMKISGCERRFGVNNPLPYGGFLCDTFA
ncbi:phage minor tail protein L [Burkholderia sp. JSH-S8]|nr:phage minor tail protein L [Burkholderia sp. JSH-S8]